MQNDASVTKLGDPAGRAAAPAEPAWRRAGDGQDGSGCGLLAGAVGGWRAVAGWSEGDLAAEPGQGLLVVADEVLAVAAVPLLVVVLAGLGVVLAAAQDRPGDADQGVRHGDGGFLLVALAEPAGQPAEPGAGPGPGPGGGPGSLGHRRPQVLVAFAGG